MTSLALLVHGARITAKIVDGLRAMVEAGELQRLPNLAIYSSHLAVRLGAIGEKEAALAHAQAAAGVSRTGRKTRGGIPDLATALNNLAT